MTTPAPDDRTAARPTTPPPPTPAAPTSPPREFPDLGFGTVVAQQVRGRFLTREGVPTSRKYGLGAQYAERFYTRALAAGWPEFLGWSLGTLLLVNGCFALAYMSLGDGALSGADALGLADPFLRAFSFSVAVFTTTGVDGVHAVGPTAHWLVVFESFVGPFFLVLAAGLLIARLTRPRMRIRFSESAVVAPYEGGRGFMFRMVNVQPGELSDVQVRVILVRFEQNDGRRERNFYPLELERRSVEFFTLHWTVVHPITADSPLRGATPESLHADEAEFLILVTAHEETFSTRVTTRASYTWEEVRWDAKFASIFASAPDGALAIDVDRLSRFDRLDAGTTSVPAERERAAVPGSAGA